MKPARERLSEKELRAMSGGDEPRIDGMKLAARECLRLRRALRIVLKMADDHAKRPEFKRVPGCGWFADARATIASALASPLAATKGGR